MCVCVLCRKLLTASVISTISNVQDKNELKKKIVLILYNFINY